tara:strand:- start:85 stop:321 length:237 start_codon:yes stop_codon:yes gene_type:complete
LSDAFETPVKVRVLDCRQAIVQAAENEDYPELVGAVLKWDRASPSDPIKMSIQVILGSTTMSQEDKMDWAGSAAGEGL